MRWSPVGKRWSQLTPGVIPGARVQDGVTERLGEGVITRVSSAGAEFVLPELPGSSFGPAPWCSSPLFRGSDHPQSIGDDLVAHNPGPAVGQRCLVGFAGPDRRPWVIGWWG